ncbi:MAG: CpaF family protein [Alphaproteobacteria bacterium]|nr:CpaF family protein [Alphaproteobacteria bacterium]
MTESSVVSFPDVDGVAASGLSPIAVRVVAKAREELDPQQLKGLSRGALARQVKEITEREVAAAGNSLNLLQQRDLVTEIVNELFVEPPSRVKPGAAPGAVSRGPSTQSGKTEPVKETAYSPKPSGPVPSPERTDAEVSASRAKSKASVEEAALRVRPILMERIDPAAAAQLTRKELARQIAEVVVELLQEESIQLNQIEQRDLVTTLVNDMLGLGPLEQILSDEKVTDIMVNGPNQVYIERGGKLTLTDIAFRDNAHLMSIASRIVTRIGRRVDETSPMVDARLEDGSRVNIIIPPLAIDGASISIRKFAKKKITLDIMAQQKNISEAMATVFKIAARCQLNILISGGTGSGKTTLLNAFSRMIDQGERVVTIEDAAELQLQQPHVVRLETRPANLEGDGEVTIRDLVKNALRMRPDRIILGECRGSEAVDMLQAMNTGHEGSMSTIHANNPRESLTRLENMFGMAGMNMPIGAVRTQIASALDLIVQVSRMRDGIRRITHVTEVVGIEGDTITSQDLFTYEYEGEDRDGMLLGTFKPSGLRPQFTEKAAYFGLDRPLIEAI